MPKKGVNNDVLVDLILHRGRFIKDCLRKSMHLKLSVVQMESLRFIHDKKKLTMHDLSDFLSISAPAVTLIVDGLQREHLVKRIHDKKDRRSTVIAMTEKGKTMIAKMKRQIAAHIASVLGKLTDNEKQDLIKILTKIGN